MPDQLEAGICGTTTYTYYHIVVVVVSPLRVKFSFLNPMVENLKKLKLGDGRQTKMSRVSTSGCLKKRSNLAGNLRLNSATRAHNCEEKEEANIP